uniref:Putative secreted protein n=1 Tax=Corethrella appendiculata TaxID=1370023 RepID=U5EP30_9DIPT
MFNILIFVITFVFVVRTESTDNETWTGLWFPHSPNKSDKSLQYDEHGRVKMGVVNGNCDDGKTNLTVDFEKNDIDLYKCLHDRRDFKGDYAIEPIIHEYTIPPAYSAMHKCMDKKITYTERLPTFGTHRPLWAKYGEYEYLPPQRWLHNSEHGAVIALYHICANKQQIYEFKTVVKNCLYRHIITPSNLLTKERPFAVITWGRSLEFSVFHPNMVKDFIRNSALRGPEQTPRDGQYDSLLIEHAKIVSTEMDTNLCPPSINHT